MFKRLGPLELAEITAPGPLPVQGEASHGQGRNAGGHPRSRNGMPAKGFKTRNKRKHSSKYIIERRKK